jgi:hypothetical protein
MWSNSRTQRPQMARLAIPVGALMLSLEKAKGQFQNHNFSVSPPCSRANLPAMGDEPPTPQQAIDEQHLKLLSIFHYIVAGLAALFACIPVIHLVIGLFMILAPQKFGNGNQQPPAFIGFLFVGLASVFILTGWVFAVLVLFAGRFIARRRRHTYCFIMACVECMFMPFGTVLGVFTILVLLRPTVKHLFTPRPVI